MKTRFYFMLSMLMLTACTKTNITPSLQKVSASSEDMLNISKAETILTSHSWMYNAYYMNYIDKNHMGDARYIRGRAHNEDQILATDRFNFKSNHNFVQKEGDYVYRGTWHFSKYTCYSFYEI